jgi:Holliday junction DNA helicase RuvA
VIGSGETSRLQKTKGIGKKTAERIVLELQDKLSAYAVETSSLYERVESVRVSDSSDDSVLALVSLGFSKAQAETAVYRALSGQTTSGKAQLEDAGDIVKAALAYL